MAAQTHLVLREEDVVKVRTENLSQPDFCPVFKGVFSGFHVFWSLRVIVTFMTKAY